VELADRMEGYTGADIESLCKKAALLAIVEFQDSARLAPFVVSRRDFLTVLQSDRGTPGQLEQAQALSHGAGTCAPTHR
jgi:SpoVK/Ycf46/Vps4 family AAA+-type ATPase